MTDDMRIVLELGPKGQRVVAGAPDWPGLERWGRDDEGALETLRGYVARYAAVAEGAGLADEFARQDRFDVVERYPGNTSTDWWGIAHVPSALDRSVLPPDEMDRRLLLLSACWAYFDAVVERVSAELRPGPRGGGRSRDEIFRHVQFNEPGQFSRKVGVRTSIDQMRTPDGRAAHRAATLDAIREQNASGRVMVGRSWTIAFLVRRVAQHAMDHAWEMEDRDLS